MTSSFLSRLCDSYLPFSFQDYLSNINVLLHKNQSLLLRGLQEVAQYLENHATSCQDSLANKLEDGLAKSLTQHEKSLIATSESVRQLSDKLDEKFGLNKEQLAKVVDELRRQVQAVD